MCLIVMAFKIIPSVFPHNHISIRRHTQKKKQTNKFDTFVYQSTGACNHDPRTPSPSNDPLPSPSCDVISLAVYRRSKESWRRNRLHSLNYDKLDIYSVHPALAPVIRRGPLWLVGSRGHGPGAVTWSARVVPGGGGDGEGIVIWWQ